MISKGELKHYAFALFDVGREENKVEAFYQDLLFLSDVVTKEPKLLKFLSSPMIPKAEKEKLLDDDIKDHVDIETLGFLKVLIKRKVISYFEEIKEDYIHLYRQSQGILEGRIYTSYPLSEKSLKRVEDTFSKKYGQQVKFKVLIDKRVLAGMKIYVEDTLYDYSLESKLNNIQDKLVQD